MELAEKPDDKSDSIPIARCRELLGDEAEALTDQEIAQIRRHAETMACMLVQTYLEHARIRIERHSGQLDELDVEGILAFAERVLPRAADLWVQATLEQRQRFQQLFFPEGIAFDGKSFVRTAATAPAFRLLAAD